jgi:hypothetical protein
MAIVTINADVSTTSTTITLDSRAQTDTAILSGSEVPVHIEGRDNIIAEYEQRGYTFTGELDCALYFEKRETTCDYDSKGQEINDYLNQGYSITSEDNCTITLDKEGEASINVILGSVTSVVDSKIISGDITSEIDDTIVIEGEMVTIEDEQVLLDEGYTYEGIIGSRKTWSKDTTYYTYDNKLKTIAEYQRKGFTYLGEENGSLKFEGTFEKCEIKNKVNVISSHEADGFTLVSEEDCKLVFEKSIESISNETDVYAFFDTTSMKQEDGVEASKALNNWFSSYKKDNPDYKGSMYILPIYYERYIDYLDVVKKGNAVGKDLRGNISSSNAITMRSGWEDIAVIPPNFDTITTNAVNSKWTPPSDVLMLAFVDETNSDYHDGKVNFANQPKPAYTEDHSRFITNLDSFNFFKAVLYPIVRNKDGEGGALILQSMAAIEGRTLSQSEITATNTGVDVSLIKSSNPYSTLTPLKDLGWVGVYDKTSPAKDVFNSSLFSKELNEVILSGAQSELNKEEKIVEGSTVSYTESVEIEGYLKTDKEYVYQEGCEIKIGDPEYFKDASFTVAYSPLMGSWISYYSYIPNFYVNHNEYFQTGLNNGVGGVWSHLLSNKSYQTFYGEVHPWIIEVPVKEQMVNRTLKDIEYYMDAKEYSGEYDYSEVRNRGFNKAWVYNNRVNSGELNLVPSKGLISDLSEYPKAISDTQQEITYSDLRGKHRFNYFYDRVKTDRDNTPIWKWDINQIHKTLNPDAISFTGKATLDQIKGDWFAIRFQQDVRTDTRFEFKWLSTSETIKP